MNTKIESLSWDRISYSAWKAVLDGHTIEFYVEAWDDDIHLEILVDGRFSTSHTDQWTGVEAVLPRLYWPEGIYRGKRWDNKPRVTLTALTQAVETFKASLTEQD